MAYENPITETLLSLDKDGLSIREFKKFGFKCMKCWLPTNHLPNNPYSNEGWCASCIDEQKEKEK